MQRSWLVIIAAVGIVLLFLPMLANRERRARSQIASEHVIAQLGAIRRLGLRKISESSP